MLLTNLLDLHASLNSRGRRNFINKLLGRILLCGRGKQLFRSDGDAQCRKLFRANQGLVWADADGLFAKPAYKQFVSLLSIHKIQHIAEQGRQRMQEDSDRLPAVRQW